MEADEEMKEDKLCTMLHLEMEPVGVFLGNTSAECDIEASPDERNCVVPFLVDASNGKIVSLDEKSCNCPGGATGCCFGNGYERLMPNIHRMLAQGFGEDATPDMPEHLKEGERFFCTDELALNWLNSLPFSQKAEPRIVFAPLSRWEEVGTPDMVFVLANPDQISAFVTLLGLHNGRGNNTIAPFGGACYSILYAAEQMYKEDPMAIMGMFDLPQRSEELAGLLSMTFTRQIWESLHRDLEKSCLTTKAWRDIEERL